MNLLLVDDQKSVLQGLLHGIDFEVLGYSRVFTALNAADAIKVCEENAINVLVTDIEMPGLSGIELIEYLQQHFPNVIRIVMTSHAKFSMPRAVYGWAALIISCSPHPMRQSPRH